MSAFTVVDPTVTATDVPLKLVFWKGAVATEMSAGPKLLPLITKTAPCAIGELNGILLAAFATLVITGAAESRAIAADIRRKEERHQGARHACIQFLDTIFIKDTSSERTSIVAGGTSGV
jgi:hypothetical protein